MGRPIGLVLAGGVGRRMGRSKGDLEVGKRRLAPRAADALGPLCRAVLISIRPGTPNPVPRCIAIEDRPPPGRGPLAGIHSAFAATDEDEADLVVLACDYPRVDTGFLRRLLELAEVGDDVVLPVDGEAVDHPLVALWRRRIADRVAQGLADGRYAVRDLLAACRVRRVRGSDFPGRDVDAALVNLNAPTDLERLEGE